MTTAGSSRAGRTALVLVTLMAVIAACGESPTRTADDGPATEGDGGRSAALLRFDPAAGDSRSTRMTMDMGMELTLDGEQAPGVELPETGMTMDITVDDVDEQIDLSFDYRDLQTSGGEEQVRQQVQQALAGMEGMSGTVSLTPRGALVDASVDAPSTLDPALTSFVDQIEQQLGQLTVQFPEEPVSVGDSWDATTEFEISGASWSIESTYTLRELGGGAYAIDVEYTQTARPGPIRGPDGQVIGEIAGGEFDGSGTVEGGLDFPFPTRASVSTSGSTRMLIRAGGGEQEMVQDMDMTIRLEPES